MNHSKSKALFEQNRRLIPGGRVSLNRRVEPEIAFVRGKGAYLYDVDGNEYIDYHAGFAPYLLGHANPVVDGATYADLHARFPELVAYPQPEGRYKLAAGWLIDRAGWKGRQIGPAGVHAQQALVLVNLGGARGADILALAQAVKADVAERFGVELEQEPQLPGALPA